MELPNYFKPEEFICDGAVVYDKMQLDFLRKLNECRHAAGVPFRLNSSYRTPEHNKKVGGSRNSMHVKGRAVDVACTDSEARAKIVRAALALGLTVGIMENAVHIDDRDKQICFHYYQNYVKK